MSEKNKTWFKLEFFVGLFFLGGIFLLLYLTIVINGKEIFFSKDRHSYKVIFPSLDTLNRNDKVYCLGVQVGTVKDFEFTQHDDGILVHMNLEKKIEFHSGYKIEIMNVSLLGGKYVHLNPGPASGRVVSENTILKGEKPFDILNEAANLISAFKEDEAIFRTEILKGEMIENLKKASEHVNKIVADIDKGDGTLSKLIHDGEFYDDAKKTFGDLKAILADAREGKGTFGKLLTDDQPYNDLKKIMADLRKFSEKLSEGKGSLGKISDDDGQLYQQISDAVTSLNKVASNMSEGKGTIGKMLTDDELYYETKSAIYQLKGAVEDFREQAPIATFGSMLLGAL